MSASRSAAEALPCLGTSTKAVGRSTPTVTTSLILDLYLIDIHSEHNMFRSPAGTLTRSASRSAAEALLLGHQREGHWPQHEDRRDVTTYLRLSFNKSLSSTPCLAHLPAPRGFQRPGPLPRLCHFWAPAGRPSAAARRRMRCRRASAAACQRPAAGCAHD